MTVTVTVNGQSGSLANGFTYNGTVAISFVQVAAATPQSSTATVAVAYPGAQTAGDLERRGSGVERHDGDGSVGERQCGECVQSGDWTDQRDGLAAVDLLCAEHCGRFEHGDGNIQPSGGVSGCTDSGVSGCKCSRCNGGDEREQHHREQRCRNNNGCQRVSFRGRYRGNDNRRGGKRIYVASDYFTGW